MAGQLGSQAAQQSERCALRLYVFLPVRAHREVCNGTGRIEEHIISPVVPRRVYAGRKKVLRAERIVQLHKSAGAKHGRGKCPTQDRKLGSLREHQVFVGVLVIAVMQRLVSLLWNDDRIAIRKLDNRGNVEDVLIVSREEKHLVALYGPAQSSPELVLLTARLESHKRRAGRERTVENEPGSVPVIQPDFVTTLTTAPPARRVPLRKCWKKRGTLLRPRSKTDTAPDTVPAPARSRCYYRPSTDSSIGGANASKGKIAVRTRSAAQICVTPGASRGIGSDAQGRQIPIARSSPAPTPRWAESRPVAAWKP